MSNTDSIGNSAETVSNPVPQNPLVDSVQAGTAAMSDTFENFLSRFEAESPASRSRIMGLILSGMESEIAPEGDFDELATKDGISPEQRGRFQRALDEAIAYHQTSESAVEVRP